MRKKQPDRVQLVFRATSNEHSYIERLASDAGVTKTDVLRSVIRWMKANDVRIDILPVKQNNTQCVQE